MKLNSAGFTLIELMVALTLGLIIVAAAVQLLISGQSTLAFQKAIENVQDNANFGINYITADLRQINLDVGRRDMGNDTVSGLIVNKKNYSTGMSTEKLPLSETNSGKTLANIGSDILVVQYRPAQLNGFDCEGNKITSNDSMIVQKYFLREDEVKKGELVLACAVGTYNVNSKTPELIGLTDTSVGQVVLQRVDQFKVLVGVINSSNQMSYLTLKQYADANASVRPVTLQIGALVRSVDNTGFNTVIPSTYTLLNSSYTVKNPNDVTGKFLRVPVEQTIAIRNAIGDVQ